MWHEYNVKPLLNKDANLIIDDNPIALGQKIWEVEYIYRGKDKTYKYFIMKKDAVNSLNSRPIGQKSGITISNWARDVPYDFACLQDSGNPFQQVS